MVHPRPESRNQDYAEEKCEHSSFSERSQKSISYETPFLKMEGLKTRDIIKLHDTLIEKYGGTGGTMI